MHSFSSTKTSTFSIDKSNNHGQELKMTTDTVYGRRFRSLMPRPSTSCSINSCTFYSTSTHCCTLNNPNMPSWSQPLSGVCGYGAKREMSRGLPLVSSRWNPTPEQLQALEEMYRGGTKTPSAEQIQQIAAKLRKFGKIEGKNVFYWFQNHKARERQKKRRQLELVAGKSNQDTGISQQRRQSGLSRRDLQIDYPKKLPTMSNCSTASKFSKWMHGAMVQLDRKELQQQTITTKSTETCCWQLDSSSLTPPNNSMHKTSDEKAEGQENAYPFVSLNICKPLTPNNHGDFRNFQSGIKEDLTLQLFPVRSNDLSNLGATKADQESHDVPSLGTKLVPNQFFEFLPTKN